MKQSRNKAYEWGEQAEDLAADYLRSKGYVVRERRWRYGASGKEIDIIAQRGDVMVFVEVKARTSADQDPLEAVDRKKIRFLSVASDAYLQQQTENYFYRFDIIGLTGNAADHELVHVEDAFLPPLMNNR